LFHCFVERKRGRIRRVNPRKVTLLIVLATSASIGFADDFKTINGKDYRNATVSRVEADGIVVKTKSGISKIYFSELSEDVQRRFHNIEADKRSINEAGHAGPNEEAAAAILTKAQEDFEVA